MTDDVRELREAIDAIKGQLTTFSTENARLKTDIENRDKADRKRAVDSHRASILDLFERAIQSNDIVANVRESFSSTYNIADDEVVMRVKVEDAKKWITNHPNPDKGKMKMTSKAGSEGDGEKTYEGPDHEVVDKAITRLRSEGKDPKDHMLFTRTVQDILREDKDLGERYKFMPDDRGFVPPKKGG